MASFTSSSEVLMTILLLVGGIALMVNGSFATAETAEEDLVSETCKQTLYSQVCESSLRSDPRSETSDLRGLAAIALNLSVAHGVHTLSYINNLKSEAAANDTDFLISGCLSDCVEEYSDAIQNLLDSIQSLNDKSYVTMNSLITAAMTDSDTCGDGFKELTGYESPLTERNQYFSRLCIASAVIYSEIKDSILKSLSEWARLAWGTWELRLLVLASLTLQLFLVKYGNRSRCAATGWVPPLVWCAYLLADWVATVTLSNILHSAESFKHSRDSTPLPPTTTLDMEINNIKFSLRTFWAPFFLLHLGGPDTITAYSVEDIELWLRRVIGVGIQVSLVIYMLFTYFSSPITRPGDPLPFVAIPVFIAGVIKCVDRVWSLWSASNKQWRSSLFSAPHKDKVHEKEKYTGSSTARTSTTSTIINVDQDKNVEKREPLDCGNVYSKAKRLHEAYMLFHVLKFLYGGVNLKISNDLSSSFTAPGSTTMEPQDAFEIVKLEIGFLYDVLYTKIPIIQSILGRTLRIISFFCSISALVAFSVIINRPPYSMLNSSDLDVTLTYLLLIGSVILEIYWVFYHIFSSWTLLWLSRDKDNIWFTSFYDFISLLKSIPSRIGWESTMFMPQLDIIRLSLHTARAKRLGCLKLFELFHDKVGRYCFTTLKTVDCNLKKSIYTYLNERHLEYGFDRFTKDFLGEILERRGNEPIRKYSNTDGELTWSTSTLDFDHSILLWHIATDMLYCFEKDISEQCERSKLISDYMFYLLLMRPTMIPHGISDLRIKDTCNEVVQVLESTKVKGMSFEEASEAMREYGRTSGCSSKNPGGYGNKSLLLDGIKLANQLLEVRFVHECRRWDMISLVWIEMLTYAASHCEWKQHAIQLGRGVELLTHVRLLMAHLGLTPQIQFSELSEDSPPQNNLPDPAQNLHYYLLCCLV